jgi:hypothetical protein
MEAGTPPAARAVASSSNGISRSPVPEPPALALFTVAFLGAAALALFWRQDANWDLLNYHYYNAWALLNGRLGIDIAPAQLQSFHNPLLDVPMYVMAAARWPPRVIAIVLCLPTAIGVFFLTRIVFMLFRDLPREIFPIAIAAALAIGLTGVNSITLNASTMNEWPGAGFALCALWLLLRNAASDAIPTRVLVLAGLLIGVASGLKLTAATYAVGLLAAIVLRSRPRRAIFEGLGFGLPVLAGVALASGYWMVLLETRFGNPLFPYFNQWFHSPLLPAEPVLLRAYGPHTLLGWLAFPFEIGFRTRGFVTEALHRDFRFPALYLLALAALVAIALERARARGAPNESLEDTGAQWRFATIFFVASFVVWTALHSVYRYLLPLELLTGAMIVRLLWKLVPAKAAGISIILIAAALIVTTKYPHWGRVEFGDHFVDVQAPPVDPNALVVVAGDEPMSYVLPAFPSDARFVGVDNNLVRADLPSGLLNRAIAAIRTHQGPRYALVFPGTDRVPLLEPYGIELVPGSCAPVRTNLTKDALALCRIENIDTTRR